MTTHDQLERRTQSIARNIYESMGKESPSLFDSGKWKGKIMETCMEDESFKVQLFRFIDVLPCLKTDALVTSLLDEYFQGGESSLMSLTHGIGRITSKGVLPGLAGKAVRSGAESFARQFIAGKNPSYALPALKKLWNQGLTFTVDLLGEAVLSDKEAQVYLKRYLEALKELGPAMDKLSGSTIQDTDAQGSIPRLDVSLKVSSFNPHLDPMNWEGSIDRTTKELEPVIETALEQGASITVDMESYHVKNLTIALFESLIKEYPEFQSWGIALQVYLKDAENDVRRVIHLARDIGKRVNVRLVKGAYWDYETVINRQRGWPVPVFLNKEDTDTNFENFTRALLENSDHVKPAIATHNVRSISHTIAIAEELGLPKEALEFQTIFGMAEPVRNTLRNMGYRVRVYTPIGELIPGMAYLIRRLLENTSNESFLRKSFVENIPIEELIKAPRSVVNKESSPQDDARFLNEPLVDFSIADNRRAMKDALEDVKKDLGKDYPLLLGEDEISANHKTESLNPARPDEVIGIISSASLEHGDRAVAEALKASESWRTTPVEQRAEYLLKAAKEMRKRRFHLAALQVYEVGKTWNEADGDVAEAIDFLEYYAREALKIGSTGKIDYYPGEENDYFPTPRGVGVTLAPWNFPLAISTGMVSAGIVTGNTVMYKPSGLSPVTGWKLVEIFREVGLPSGVLQYIPGPGHIVGEQLVKRPEVDYVAFTGSKEVGLRITELASETRPDQRNIKKVIAEMGGKNAIIVDETADLDEAVKGTLDSAIGFQGQKCSACSRVIIVGAAYNEFIDRLIAAMECVHVGPPEDPGNHMGPVIDKIALDRINKYIGIGEKDGRTLVNRTHEGKGYFVGPALFTDLETDSVLMQEEIFGPVLGAIKAKNMDEAIKIANGTPYALTGGIYSRSPSNIKKVIREFRVGNLYVNRKITASLVSRQPFGGFGMSGVGSKTGGPEYLLQFVNMVSVSENTLRRGFATKGLRM